MTAAAFAYGDEGAVAFHVAGGPLDGVLLEIARQARVVLSFDGALARGRQAATVDGTMTAADAFARALAGTSLELVAVDGGTWTLRRVGGGDARASNAMLPPIRVRARGDEDSGFVELRSSAAARLELPLVETPQSVGVVNRSVLDSQQAESVADALANVSGATPVYDESNANYGVGIRGYTAQAPLVDGMIVESADYPPLAGIERVEVVKGPATALAGGAPNGGIVNLVTKQPRFDRHATWQTTVSSRGRHDSMIDLGDASGDGRLGYRFVASGSLNGRTYGGYDGQRSFFVAPSVRYRDADTDVMLRIERYRQRVPALPYSVGGDDGLPLPHTSLEPAGARDDHLGNDSLRAALSAERRLGERWKARLRATWLNYESVSHWYVPYAPLDSAGDIELYGLHSVQRRHESLVAGELLRTFDARGVSGTVLAGVEHWRLSSTADILPYTFADQNLYVPRPLPSIPTGPLTRTSDSAMRQLSGYLQLNMLIADRLRLLGSLRHTNALLDKSLSSPLQRNAVWSPSLAASYAITPSISVYANWLRGFRPSLDTVTWDGKLLQPTRTEQFEAGVKLSLFGDALTATAAAYRLRDDGKIIGDPLHPGFYARVPGERSRGLEFDVVGRILKGLDVIGSLTLSGSNATSNPDGTQIRAPGAPARAGSLWMTYAFQGQPLSGWGVGSGVFFRSQRAAGLPGYVVPGDARVDAALFYRARKWAAQLGVKNIFDRRLYGAALYPNFIPVLPGRTFVLTTTLSLG
ncbi:TonB-dependent siderophore receptor [Burkholderia cepacia]|uniref:TonB-dependent siderophore receptor n=1 Tax=Burkholderia cepacia TaxID=292 RepID=UPI0018C5E1CA|nr:TonB-dependent siderophore receptor [Burkholderia cepacia]